MKKTIGIILMVMFSFASYCQDTASKQIPDTSKVTWTKVYNDVKGALVGMGAALKTSAEHVYAVLIKQQIVNSIVYAIIILLLFVSLIISISYLRKDFKAFDNTGHPWHGDSVEDHLSSVLLTILSIVLFGTLVVVAGNVMSPMISGFVNPEYGALKDIMEFVR